MKQRTLSFAAGLLCGMLLFGGGVVAYAAGIMAERSTQTFYLDGKQIQMEAYAINGNNYVKLRDVGQAVDFGVSYDGTNNSVRIDTTSSYVAETKPAATPNMSTNADGSINIPDGDAKLILKEGDVIRCDDGTNYTITDMSRYDANAFASGPLPALPTATCDWSSFPAAELPAVEVRHFNNEAGDFMFVRNLYETRRMQYTLWNLAGNNPETSENGRLKYGSKGTPYVRTHLSISSDIEPQVFWPWKESQIKNLFESCPIGTYRLEVWDVYGDGVFQHTRYCIDASAS